MQSTQPPMRPAFKVGRVILSEFLGVVTGEVPTHPQAFMTSATAATETDPKAVAEEPAGRARVAAADRRGGPLPQRDGAEVELGQMTTLCSQGDQHGDQHH